MMKAWMSVVVVAGLLLGCNNAATNEIEVGGDASRSPWIGSDAGVERDDAGAIPTDGTTPAEPKDAAAPADPSDGEAESDGGIEPVLDATVDPVSPAFIMSAYLGLLDANAILANRLELTSGCDQVAGDDAMPVVFSVHLDEPSVQTDDFRVVTASGAGFTPTCATLRPATGADERRTVLLTGPFGTAADPPARVEVVGELTVTDVEGTTLGAVSGLVSPAVRTSAEGTLIEKAIHWSSGARAQCADGRVRVQTTWSGGVKGPRGREFDARDLNRFLVEAVDVATGETQFVNPLSFGDLNDNDNHLDLCIAVGLSPRRVSAMANTAFDPTNNPNPATSAAIEIE